MHLNPLVEDKTGIYVYCLREELNRVRDNFFTKLDLGDRTLIFHDGKEIADHFKKAF